KIAINGFGRIGRQTAGFLFDNKNIEIVAINDLTEPKTLAHLLKYDSVHGRFGSTVESGSDYLKVGGKKIQILSQPDPAKLPWKDLGVDLVLECTGRLKDRDAVAAHLKNGAKKVLYSAPLKGADLTVVIGVNHEEYDPSKHDVISNASCTTNCLAPVAKVLNDNYKIQKGFMTTIHSYTNDQKILDLPHSDLRRSRAAAVSMIPTTTGAAKAVGLVLPDLKGKLDGFAVRVPTPNVSAVDLVAVVDKSTTKEEINEKMKAASEGALKGVLAYTDEPLVSIDFNGVVVSSTFDSALTNVIDGNLVKVFAWYDNESGYSKRFAELTEFVGKRM
ncbi:MAG: type I glyceraldehyde-3-phosphate dehydrogenase, partial [Oligoflexia bacterium]|nr:type I glyceraldehyde-3-phosphate dehydrogenase [Oligoflexia bacterium]